MIPSSPVSCWDTIEKEGTATSASRRRCQPLRRLRRRRRRRRIATTIAFGILAAVLVVLPASTITALAFRVTTTTALLSPSSLRWSSSTPRSTSMRTLPSGRSYLPSRLRSGLHPALLFNAAGKDEVTMNLERARAVLEKAKQKLASRDENNMIRGTAIATATMVAERVEGPSGTAEARDDELSSSSTSSQPPLPYFASRDVTPNGGGRSVTTFDSKRRHVIKSIDESTGLITTDGEKMARLSEEEAWEARSLLEVFDNEISDKDVYSATSQQLATRDVAASIWNLRKTLQLEDYKKIFDEKNRFIGEGN